MKIIEAMKKVKANKEKVTDLRQKIGSICANLAHETKLYGTETAAKVKEFLQACDDISQENVRLLCAIQKTNLATSVTIELGGKQVTKTIAEWIWRRREYAAEDYQTWSVLTDRGIKEGQAQTTTGTPFELKLERHYDPVKRDEMIAMYRAERHQIDAALEVVNATTDLM
jgi:hypothetical protein